MLYRTLLTVVMVFFSDTLSILVHPLIIIMNSVMLVFLCRVRPYKNNVCPILNSILVLGLGVPYIYKQINDKLEGTHDFF
jgi:hypothetical protein